MRVAIWFVVEGESLQLVDVLCGPKPTQVTCPLTLTEVLPARVVANVHAREQSTRKEDWYVDELLKVFQISSVSISFAAL